MTKLIGYIRVSTVEQKTARQLEGIQLDKVFEDKCSAKDTKRPQLQALLEFVREGDTLHVHDISRLARNLEDLLSLVRLLTGKGVAVKFMKENLHFTGDATNPMQVLMLNLLGAVYQFERSLLLERQREGIKLAKEAGKYKGGKARVDEAKVIEALNTGLSIRKTAETLKIGISTVQRIKSSSASHPEGFTFN